MAGPHTETLRCNGCWRDTDRTDLDSEQMCPDCTQEISTKPPPPGQQPWWARSD